MKKVILKLFILMNMVMMSMVVMPTSAFAADGIPYLDAAGVKQIAPTATEVTVATDVLTSGWYVVNADVTKVGTITVVGDVHLILMDGFVLTVNGSDRDAGINVAGSNRLTIYGQTTSATMGKIIAKAGYELESNGDTHDGGAGIGGGKKENGGVITINGGEINAVSTGDAAAIGGGGNGTGGIITINGGIVSARTEMAYLTSDGAGIGSGRNDGYAGEWNKKGTNISDITINGGKITAIGHLGAGIGGGFASDGGNITINGGTIEAISYGYLGYDYGSGAGIGGGSSRRIYSSYKEPWQGNGGNITITGGHVTAISKIRGAGIGGGGGNTNNEATNKGGNSGTIIISGGIINATGANAGAGIGSGRLGDIDIIKISGGTVFADSNKGYANDIGSGLHSTLSTLSVSGTSAVFLRHNNSAPVTTLTHGHQVFSAATEVTGYSVPTSWDSEFGAWLPLALSTVEFDSAGGSEVPSITQEQGTILIPPVNPTREGYTFVGWNPALPETMPLEGVVLTAQWRVNATEPGEGNPAEPGDSGSTPGGNNPIKPGETEVIGPGTNIPSQSGDVESEDDKKFDALPETGDNNIYSLAGFVLLLLAAGLNILLKWDQAMKDITK